MSEEKEYALTSALLPFFLEDWTDENGWTENAAQNDRIRDWFGPSDFEKVKKLLQGLTALSQPHNTKQPEE